MALYRVAASEGHLPEDGEVMVQMGQARERIGGLHALFELQQLAQQDDLAGFRELIESPFVRNLIVVQEEEHLLALFEQAKETDLSGSAEGMAIHTLLLESIGDDRYWTGVFFDHTRRLLAIEALRSTFGEMNADQQASQAWQDLSEKTRNDTAIKLTDAAPKTITLTNVRSYMNGLQALERDLMEIYRNETPPSAPASPTPSLNR